MKKIKMYQIRIEGVEGLCSRQVGFKHQLRPYQKACRIVKFLKRRGFNAYHAAMEIII